MKRLTLLFAALLPFVAFAQEADLPAAVPEKTLETVQIHGQRDPDWKPYKRMLLGLDTFAVHRSLAPDAPLLFVLRPQEKGLGFEGVVLRIAGNTQSHPLELDEQGRFTLPRIQALADDDAELHLNRKKGMYRWRPDVRSPGVPEGMRRLGDLRMECEVRWAVEYDDLNFVFRNYLRALGGPCNAAHIHVVQFHPQTLAAVTLVDGQRRQKVPTSKFTVGGRGYVVPLHDQGWPDSTLVEFTLAQPPADSKTGG